MACTLASSIVAPVASVRVSRPASSRVSRAAFGRAAGLSSSNVLRAPQQSLVAAPRKSAVVTQASAQEIASLAFDQGFIWEVAGIMVAITLLGVATGFVLIRVESLVQEGKL